MSDTLCLWLRRTYCCIGGLTPTIRCVPPHKLAREHWQFWGNRTCLVWYIGPVVQNLKQCGDQLTALPRVVTKELPRGVSALLHRKQGHVVLLPNVGRSETWRGCLSVTPAWQIWTAKQPPKSEENLKSAKVSKCFNLETFRKIMIGEKTRRSANFSSGISGNRVSSGGDTMECCALIYYIFLKK